MSAAALSFLILIVIAVAAFFIWLIYSRRYQRASQETAFVRTGYGGQKVVMSGGALVFPVLHEVTPVNMNTMRLDVIRATNQALITKDRMRMDVQAEFYVRVRPTLEDIAMAAQTLGRRTMNPDALKTLVEGKFVNSLRSVAAEMNMDELHQNRAEFVRRVQDTVGDGLSKNGLELESVSLSELDQTDRKFFNPQNAFDAEGLMLLTEMIQARSKQRNAIERDTEVAIKKKDLEAERQKLELSKEEEFARLEQEKEIQVRRAEQRSKIAIEQVEKERLAKEAELTVKKQVEHAQLATEQAVEEERIAKDLALSEKEIAKQRSLEVAQADRDRDTKAARIQSEKQTEMAQIQAERAVEEERLSKQRLLTEREIEQGRFIDELRIEREQLIKEREIASGKSIEAAEIEKTRQIREARLQADQLVDTMTILVERELEEERIAKEQTLRAREIAKALNLELAEIERKNNIEIADLTRLISLSEKTKEHTRALTEVDQARAVAARAEEQIVTARQLEISERQKAMDLVDARKIAEREAIGIVQTAEARMKAAVNQAETVGIIAAGEADKIRKVAEAESEVAILKTKSAEKRYRVDADGKRALNEAENTLDAAKTAARTKMAIIEHLAEIIRESVKPMESIEGIKILHVEGLSPVSGVGHNPDSPAGSGNLADQLVNSALRYRGQAPLLDAILKEIGLAGGDINGLTAALGEMSEQEEKNE